MTFPTTLRFAVIALVLALMAPTMSMAQRDEPITVSRFYQVHYLRHDMVEILATQACGGRFGGYCRMTRASEGFLEFTATEEQQATLAAELEARDVPPPTQVFQVHVLRAKTEPQPRKLPQLPENAVRALNDLMQLLPYRGFELVDSGLMRTSGEAELFLGSDRRYEARLQFQGDPGSGKPLQISFRLLAEKLVPGEDGKVFTAGMVSLLATTFSMKVGETVVVGTSKLNGGSEALVVLLSAAP